MDPPNSLPLPPSNQRTSDLAHGHPHPFGFPVSASHSLLISSGPDQPTLPSDSDHLPLLVDSPY